MATAQLTVSINTSSCMGEKRSAERAQMQSLLRMVAQAIGDGVSNSGTIRDHAGVSAGTWTYTPGASS